MSTTSTSLRHGITVGLCHRIAFGLLVLSLAGCGGSSNDGAAPDPAPLPPPPITDDSTGELDALVSQAQFRIFGVSEATQGESVGFAVLNSSSTNYQYQWTQTAGPALSILADRSPVVGFDLVNAGDYGLNLQVLSQDSQTLIEEFDLSFVVSPIATNAQSAIALPQVNVRLDHSASELAKVSFHASFDASVSSQTPTWRQIAGPRVESIDIQGNFIFFDAPSVTKDELLAFEVALELNDGSSISDEVLLVVEQNDIDTNGLFYANGFVISPQVRAYRPDSPYKEALENCVYNNQIPSRPNCDFSQLPLVFSSTSGQDTIPSVDDILDRTLVSHQWMGDNFRNYLENSAAGRDMRAMLRAVTAIVISYDVRPSFYWVATGAIYLDANNFWRSPEQRDTLNDQADFRSDFGNDLGFSIFWRYTKDQAYYPGNIYDKDERSHRSFEDLEASISWLMYHELAHANDFFPSDVWASLPSSQTPLSYFQNNAASSDTLGSAYPLRSDEMHALAQVSFAGETASTTQKNYMGSDIEQFFAPDLAPSYYAYLNEREDFATLVERFMMLYRLEAEADVAIIDRRLETREDDFTITWGQRNRIQDPALFARSVFAVERVYPELGNIAEIKTTLPPAQALSAGEGWFESIRFDGGVGTSQSQATTKGETYRQDFDYWKNLRRKHAEKDVLPPHPPKPQLDF